MVQRLTDEGIRAHKINFNGGDAWYSRDIDAVSYRGTIEAWPAYLEDFISRENISDIFVYGDCRVYHRLAKEVARRSNIRFYRTLSARSCSRRKPRWLSFIHVVGWVEAQPIPTLPAPGGGGYR